MKKRTTSIQAQHALITGAGRGIGAAIAKRLAQEGVSLTLVGRNLAPLQALAKELSEEAGIETQALACDVTDSQALVECFNTARQILGPIHILVNNAGQAQSAPLTETTDDLWHAMLAINLTAPFLGARAVMPDMLKAGWGRIINIASTAGQRGYPYVSAYVSAKHGVIGLTRALAVEVATRGITVNAICPGYTNTDLFQQSVNNLVQKTGRSDKDARTALTRFNPQGRLIEPQEVADTVAWLCSPAASALTGQSISVSCGEVM